MYTYVENWASLQTEYTLPILETESNKYISPYHTLAYHLRNRDSTQRDDINRPTKKNRTFSG